MYHTIEELECMAYMRNDQVMLSTMAQVETETIEAQQSLFDNERDDLKADSLSTWERKNGPVKEYYDFFHDCFARLDGHYPCPSVTSDYDKSIVFNAIRKGEGTTE